MPQNAVLKRGVLIPGRWSSLYELRKSPAYFVCGVEGGGVEGGVDGAPPLCGGVDGAPVGGVEGFGGAGPPGTPGGMPCGIVGCGGAGKSVKSTNSTSNTRSDLAGIPG